MVFFGVTYVPRIHKGIKMKPEEFLKQVNLTEFGKKVGRSTSQVYHWKVGLKPIPLELCTLFETESNGLVMRWDIRPNDWYLIWPELKKRKDAPKIEVADV